MRLFRSRAVSFIFSGLFFLTLTTVCTELAIVELEKGNSLSRIYFNFLHDNDIEKEAETEKETEKETESFKEIDKALHNRNIFHLKLSGLSHVGYNYLHGLTISFPVLEIISPPPEA
jgi:hypothetical protein